MKVEDFLYEFVEALKEQLDDDHTRWGDTWLHRSKGGQELRVKAVFDNYFDSWMYAGENVPWLKIVGNAMIAWIRDEHPELFPDG